MSAEAVVSEAQEQQQGATAEQNAEEQQMVFVVASENGNAPGGQEQGTPIQIEGAESAEQAQEILLKLDPSMEETLSQVEEGSTIIILNAPEDGAEGEDNHNLNVMAEVATAVTSGTGTQILMAGGENGATIASSAETVDNQFVITNSDGTEQMLPLMQESATSTAYSASTPQLQNVKRTYPKKIDRDSNETEFPAQDSEPTNRNGELYITPAISVGNPEDDKFPEYIKVDDDSLTKDDLPDYVTVVGLSGMRRRFLLSDDKYWDGKLVYVRMKDALDAL